jgi:diadenosine tetraphosphate (Ap4A) HIT family hydrolase
MSPIRPTNELDPACPMCARIHRIRAGADPFFICELRRSYVVLHKHQSYRGWCSLFLTTHAEQTELLPRAVQAQLWEDVMDVASAIRAALEPRRLNFENLGNVVPHVHWHVIPRYYTPIDPEPGATIWVRPESERDCGCSDEVRTELIHSLRGVGLASAQ